MQLQYVTGGCNGGPCPTVYQTDRGTLLIQGYVLGPRRKGGAHTVTVPFDLLGAAAASPGVRRISRDALSVTGTPVSADAVTGLGQIAPNEGLVEVRLSHPQRLPVGRHFDAKLLDDWLAKTSAAVRPQRECA